MTTLATGNLQQLATFHVEEPAAISLYLNLDPSLAPIPANLQTRVNSLLTAARRKAPAGASHETRMAFDAALDRIEGVLSDMSRLPTNRTHGMAVLASGEDVFELVELPRAVDDRLAVARRFCLLPLAAAASRPDDVMLLLVSREQGKLWRYRGGHLTEVFDDFERAERRHDQGGWEQADLQRWHDQAAAEHIERVIEHFDRVHAEAGRPPVLLAADEEATAVAKRVLGKEAREAVARVTPAVRDEPADRLMARAEEALGELATGQQERLLERWRTQLGQPGGRGTGSPADTMEAVSDARVEWLLLAARPEVAVYECVQCGRLAPSAGQCPLDGAPRRLASDGVEALVGRTLAHGGRVWQLDDVDRDDLDPAGGLAAITRF